MPEESADALSLLIDRLLNLATSDVAFVPCLRGLASAIFSATNQAARKAIWQNAPRAYGELIAMLDDSHLRTIIESGKPFPTIFYVASDRQPVLDGLSIVKELLRKGTADSSRRVNDQRSSQKRIKQIEERLLGIARKVLAKRERVKMEERMAMQQTESLDLFQTWRCQDSVRALSLRLQKALFEFQGAIARDIRLEDARTVVYGSNDLENVLCVAVISNAFNKRSWGWRSHLLLGLVANSELAELMPLGLSQNEFRRKKSPNIAVIRNAGREVQSIRRMLEE